MPTPITATFPTVNFPKRGELERDAFVQAQENAQDVLSDHWNTAATDFKNQTNTLATELNNLVEGQTATQIHSATAKTTPSDNDELGIVDSASSWALKKLTWANLKIALGSLFVTKVTSTDNAIVRFDGTSGQVQNSSVVIDDSGNAGFGTINPKSKIQLGATANIFNGNGSNANWLDLAYNVYYNGGYKFTDTIGTQARLIEITGSSISFYRSTNTPIADTAATFATDMTLDSSGNLGLGVTPSAWGSQHKAIQYGYGTSLSAFQAGGGETGLNHNAYSNGSDWIYILGGNKASRYSQNGTGNHTWYTAPSGTAGNPIPWTNAMTLETDGDLLVPRMYSQTTASASNCFVDSAGQIFRSTSARKYKTNIEDIDKPYVDNFFKNARPIYYKSLSENDNSKWGYWGFIAEEIAEFDKRLVHWAYQTKEIEVEKERVIQAIEEDLENGIEAQEETIEKYTEKQIVNDLEAPMVAEGVMYERVVVLLTAKVQELEERLNILENKYGGVEV